MITIKLLIFTILSGVLGVPDDVPTSGKNFVQNEQTKQKRSLVSLISPDGDSYNEHNVLYNEDSPYGDGFYGFELFRQFFEKSGTIVGSLSKLLETFSYKNIRSDLMLLRRFLNIIIRLATLFNSFLPVPQVSNTAMEEFSKLHPGISITVVKNEESGGLPDISDIPEKPESVYDYVTKKPNGEHQQKELNEEDVIKELSKIDLQRINSPNKRHQGSNSRKEAGHDNNENRIYFPSTSLPEKASGSSTSLEDFIRDRNRVKTSNSNTPRGSSEILKTHPKIDLRSHHIYEADLTVLNNKRNKNT